MTKQRKQLVGHNIHLSIKQDELLPLLQEKTGLNKSELFREALFMLGCRYRVQVPRDGMPGGVQKRGPAKKNS